jgi:hypothetical protein
VLAAAHLRACALCLAGLGVTACGKTEGAARPSPPDAAAPVRVPAPNSPLARELGADDAGCGRLDLSDGAWCGFAPRVDRGRPLRSDAAGGWLDFFETKTSPQDQPRAYERAAISLDLTAPKRALVDEPIALGMTLLNRSAEPFRFSRAVDGSFEHWRGPFVDLYAHDERTGRTYAWTYGKGFGRCGNLDPRTPEDFVTLAPNQRRSDPFESSRGSRLAMLAPTFRVEGRYTLWVVYASSCFGIQRRERDDPTPADLFEGTIASNGVTLDVVRAP